jgi:Tfp pilus assembly protein PilF
MNRTRLEILQEMAAATPDNSFIRYGLAMEYRNLGDLKSAVREFRALIAADPDYPAAYFQAGQTLERLGRPEEAAALYRQGMEAASRKGDLHAREEMQAALELLS